ncbi:SdrD B-like domain-containing protein [Listeria newyorkensis]|uniref:SdrD B-like domain-containing protein n=1 Tax=Listeria newyorkensis TaxID=1497681 RepID=UPI0010F5334A|nr:SdrD B-like domain-containing protein [Listeria newyorkensis]
MNLRKKVRRLGSTFIAGTLIIGIVTPTLTPMTASATTLSKSEAKVKALKAGTGSVSDFMFEDLNGNNRKDPGEKGVAGISITLYSDSGQAVATTTTDANGAYNFTNLGAGTYYLHVDMSTIPKSEKLYTTTGINGQDGNSSYFSVADGQTVTGFHFGFTPQVGKIASYVWNDKNGNGLQDPGEAGIANVNIILFDIFGAQIATTTTDANGNYQLDSIAPGQYYEKVQTPSGMKLVSSSDNTFGGDGVSGYFQISSASDITNMNVGLQTTHNALLQGIIKNDTTGNGIANITVNLYNTDGSKVSSTTTDATGNYTFTSLPAGNYYMTAEVPSNYDVTSATGFGFDANSYYIHLEDSTAIRSFALGLKQKVGAIHSTIYNDVNKNGKKDSGEQGLSGVRVDLYDTSGQSVANTVTDANGDYAFNNVTPGTYYIRVTTPQGYSTQANGQFGSDNVSGYFVVSANQTLTNLNDGMFQTVIEPTGISMDTSDINTLTGDKGKINASVEPSNATNKALTYTVANPSVLSIDADGNWTALTKGETDITVTTSNGIKETVHVVVAQKVGEIKSFVFDDINKDGTKEPGELGVAGVTVALHNVDGSTIATQQTDEFGLYDFKDVPAGNYYIVVTTPKGYTIKANYAFGNDGVTGYIPVKGNDVVSNYNCALIKDVAPTTVSSIKWIYNKSGGNIEMLDRNNITIQDDYFDAYNNPHVNIQLYDQNNSVIDLTGYTVTMGDTSIATGTVYGPGNNVIALTRYKIGATSVTIKDPSGRVVKNFVLNIVGSTVPATDIILGATNINTTIGKAGQIDATVQPANATDKSLIYTSADPSILTVGADGTWEAKREGTTTVAVQTSNGITKTITVKVTSPITMQLQNIPLYPDRIIVENDQINIDTNYVNTYGSHDLDFKLYDLAGTQLKPGDYTTTSSDLSIIQGKTDQGDGYMRLAVKGKAGSTVIAVKDAKGNIVRQFTVNVSQGPILPTGVTVDTATVSTTVTNAGKINATVQPENATNKTLTYTSSDPSILKVNADGTWEALKNGTATVTVKTANGFAKTVTFTVAPYFSDIMEQGNFNPDKSHDGPVTYYDTVQGLTGADNVTLTYSTLDSKVATEEQTNGRRQFIFYINGGRANFNTDYNFSISNTGVLDPSVSNNNAGARDLGHIEVRVVARGTSTIIVTRNSDGKVVKTLNVTVK